MHQNLQNIQISQEKYANLASKNNEMPLSRGIFVHPANKVILLGWTFFACVFVKFKWRGK